MQLTALSNHLGPSSWRHYPSSVSSNSMGYSSSRWVSEGAGTCCGTSKQIRRRGWTLLRCRWILWSYAHLNAVTVDVGSIISHASLLSRPDVHAVSPHARAGRLLPWIYHSAATAMDARAVPLLHDADWAGRELDAGRATRHCNPSQRERECVSVCAVTRCDVVTARTFYVACRFPCPLSLRSSTCSACSVPWIWCSAWRY